MDNIDGLGVNIDQLNYLAKKYSDKKVLNHLYLLCNTSKNNLLTKSIIEVPVLLLYLDTI